MTGEFVETDSRGRITLVGDESRSLLMRDLTDGCVLLVPVRVDPAAQAEYDTSEALRQLLDAATSSPTVSRPRSRDCSE